MFSRETWEVLGTGDGRSLRTHRGWNIQRQVVPAFFCWRFQPKRPLRNTTKKIDTKPQTKCNRRATAHAADPRFHGNLRHERKKKGSKKKEVRFFGWGRLSGRVRFEVSSVGCVSGSVYGDFLDSFWGAVLRCRLLFNWWCSMGECIEHLRNRWNQSKTTAWMEPRRRPSAPGAKRLSTS